MAPGPLGPGPASPRVVGAAGRVRLGVPVLAARTVRTRPAAGAGRRGAPGVPGGGRDRTAGEPRPAPGWADAPGPRQPRAAGALHARARLRTRALVPVLLRARRGL